MAAQIIKVGDKVLWRGSWGDDPEKEAELVSIEMTEYPRQKYGTEVPAAHWEKGEWSFPFIATLDNGKWAYSDQIKPMAKGE